MSNNCQVHTPDDYVIKMLDYMNYKKGVYGKSVLENSCGTGNILTRVVERYILDALENDISLNEIIMGLERDITGYDIDNSSLIVCKKRLDEIASGFGLYDIKWNIKRCDYLKTPKKKYDFIIGNPPYITYHDLKQKQRNWIKKKYTTCTNGRFDYYYAFVEKSVDSLSMDGTLVYLIPFNIFRNKYAQNLREHIKETLFDVYDFSGIELFDDVIISSTIIVCKRKANANIITYHGIKNTIEKEITKNELKGKWFFVDEEDKGLRFGDFFSINNGVATLLNEAFLISDYSEDEEYLYVDGLKIEKKIVRPAVSVKTLKRKKNSTKEDKIIFPYRITRNGYEKYTEKEFVEQFPETYKYLKKFYQALKKRKVDKTAQWYEYGRSQAISNIKGEKLVFSMVFTKQIKAYRCGSMSVPYAGYFLKCKKGSIYTLSDAKKILESPKFYEYVKAHGTPTTAESFRISVEEIENYRFYES